MGNAGVIRAIGDAFGADPTAVVNLVGPLGSGKTTLLAELAGPAVVDGVDTAGAGEALAGRAGPLVVAGRIPLRSLPGWSAAGALVTIEVPAWSEEDVTRLAATHDVQAGPGLDLVRRLSGGVPLIAVLLCRALHSGAPADVPGAVADHAATGILDRLGSEASGPAPAPGSDAATPAGPPDIPAALAVLAAVGEADADLVRELIDLPFDALDRLSLTRRTGGGLAVAEPFRTLLDEAFRWREPVTHQVALTRATAHTRHLLETAGDRAGRDRLIFRSWFLTGDRVVRDTLFPTGEPHAAVGPAAAADLDDIERLVHQWARRGGLDPRSTGRILDGWMRSTPDGFLVARTPDGRAIGVAHVPPVTERSIASMEPVLQQHTETVTANGDLPADSRGVFVGLAFCDEREPEVHALLLRAILRPAFAHGGVVVSTMWPEYQQLVRRLGFAYRGAAADDVYGCGRPCEVYTHSFAPGRLGGWLDDLTSRGVPTPLGGDVARLRRHLRAALEGLHDPAALARSPLLAVTGSTSPEALHDWLRAAVSDLVRAEDRLDAEAGRTLDACYGRAGTVRHDRVAQRLHHSRATHFRRLDRGLTLLATRLLLAPVTGAPESRT
ncbi:hypothetical protein AB0M43_12440 [Longispora sp. NPDC051575]|uniref:hypothetical protein n=1 Tax=Longispora sp. NPDC051575 TaxID=3154943 RepID=UPI0034457FF4